MKATYQADPSVWNDPDLIFDIASGRFGCVNLESVAEPSHVLEKIPRNESIPNLDAHLLRDLDRNGGKAYSAHLPG